MYQRAENRIEPSYRQYPARCPSTASARMTGWPAIPERVFPPANHPIFSAPRAVPYDVCRIRSKFRDDLTPTTLPPRPAHAPDIRIRIAGAGMVGSPSHDRRKEHGAVQGRTRHLGQVLGFLAEIVPQIHDPREGSSCHPRASGSDLALPGIESHCAAGSPMSATSLKTWMSSGDRVTGTRTV